MTWVATDGVVRGRSVRCGPCPVNRLVRRVPPPAREARQPAVRAAVVGRLAARFRRESTVPVAHCRTRRVAAPSRAGAPGRGRPPVELVAPALALVRVRRRVARVPAAGRELGPSVRATASSVTTTVPSGPVEARPAVHVPPPASIAGRGGSRPTTARRVRATIAVLVRQVTVTAGRVRARIVVQVGRRPQLEVLARPATAPRGTRATATRAAVAPRTEKAAALPAVPRTAPLSAAAGRVVAPAGATSRVALVASTTRPGHDRAPGAPIPRGRHGHRVRTTVVPSERPGRVRTNVAIGVRRAAARGAAARGAAVRGGTVRRGAAMGIVPSTAAGVPVARVSPRRRIAPRARGVRLPDAAPTR